MKVGDIVITPKLSYGEVKNVYRDGRTNKDMADIEIIGACHPAQMGLRETHAEKDLIITQEALDA